MQSAFWRRSRTIRNDSLELLRDQLPLAVNYSSFSSFVYPFPANTSWMSCVRTYLIRGTKAGASMRIRRDEIHS